MYKKLTVSCVFFILNKIKHNGLFCSSISHDLINECELTGTILEFEDLNYEYLIFNGKYGGDIVSKGDFSILFLSSSVNISDKIETVFPIKSISECVNVLSDLYVRNPPGSLNLVNNPFKSTKISKIFEIKQITPEIMKSDMLKCKKCSKKIPRERMRQHIGQHLIRKDIEVSCNICGFCSGTNCSEKLIVTSGRGSTKTTGVWSNCPFFYDFSLKSATKSNNFSPCTNRPIACNLCKEMVIWSYNIKHHYESFHKDVLIPSEFEISDKEIKAVKNLKI